MFTNSRCYKKGNKHKFEPRFEFVLTPRSFEHHGYSNAQKLVELLKDKLYICDICVWCGKKINKN